MGDRTQLSFRHKWILRLGQERKISEGARLLGIMAVMEFGKPEAGREFWPSHKALAELVGVTERTAERRINELVSANLIEKWSGAGGKSNRYVPVLPSDPDSSDGVEADKHPDNRDKHPDNRDKHPDSSDGVTPTPVSGRPRQQRRGNIPIEQTQQHTHEQAKAVHVPGDAWCRAKKKTRGECVDCLILEAPDFD